MCRSSQIVAFTLVAVLFLASCSDNYDEVSRRYRAEKLLFQANRVFETLTATGKINTPEERQKLLDQYLATLQYCRQSLESFHDTAAHPAYREIGTVAFGAANRIAQLYFANGQYDRGAGVLDTLLTTFPLTKQERINSSLNLGQALHTGGRIDSALAVYHRLIASSGEPLGDRGTLIYPLFNLPLHVYKVARAAGKASVDNDFAIAEKYYSKLLHREDFARFRDACNTNLAMLYIEAGFWNEAIGHLTEIRDSTGAPHIAAGLRAIDIMSDKLDQTRRAGRELDSLLSVRSKSDTIYYPILIWKKAAIEMKSGNQAEARHLLNQIKQEFRNYYDRTPLVQLMLAQSFEKEDNWSRAKLEYDLLFEKFPYSDEAMGSFMHVYDYYRKNQQIEEGKRTLEEARKVFQRATDLGKGTLAEARAVSFLADLYVAQQKYDSAGQVLIRIADNFKGTLIARQALKSAADIYQSKLGDAVKADSLRAAISMNLNQSAAPVDLTDQLNR